MGLTAGGQEAWFMKYAAAIIYVNIVLLFYYHKKWNLDTLCAFINYGVWLNDTYNFPPGGIVIPQPPFATFHGINKIINTGIPKRFIWIFGWFLFGYWFSSKGHCR